MFNRVHKLDWLTKIAGPFFLWFVEAHYFSTKRTCPMIQQTHTVEMDNFLQQLAGGLPQYVSTGIGLRPCTLVPQISQPARVNREPKMVGFLLA